MRAKGARAGVSEDTFTWLAARLHPVALHALHALQVVGEPVAAVYFLVRGQLSVVRRGLVVGRISQHSCCFGGGLLLQLVVAEEGAAAAGGAGGAAEEAPQHHSSRWPCTVQASTEADVFALHLDDMRALTRGQEELLELVRSLARVDAMQEMDITGEGSAASLHGQQRSSSSFRAAAAPQTLRPGPGL